jgi:hypothetical protein
VFIKDIKTGVGVESAAKRGSHVVGIGNIGGAASSRRFTDLGGEGGILLKPPAYPTPVTSFISMGVISFSSSFFGVFFCNGAFIIFHNNPQSAVGISTVSLIDEAGVTLGGRAGAGFGGTGGAPGTKKPDFVIILIG